jgi:predicted PurR-regulated permease PerM
MQAPLPFLMTRLAAWLGVALLAVLVLWLLAPVLAPFVIAAVMAYVLHPLVIRLEGVSGGRLPRALAVVLVEALALLSLLGLFLLLVPILVREWPLLQQQLPLLLDRVGDAINPLLAQLGLNVSLDLGELKKQLVTYLSANREDWWDCFTCCTTGLGWSTACWSWCHQPGASDLMASCTTATRCWASTCAGRRW